jgi:uncharacterized protein YndB with AHSA1/START domain
MTAPTAADRRVRLVRRIRAPRERLFDAWTKPELLKVWMSTTSDPVRSCDLDVKDGSAYAIVFDSPKTGTTCVVTGRYLEVRRPERLRFTWITDSTHWTQSVVTVELRELGARETELTLTHEQFPDDKSAADHDTGWSELLPQLAQLAEKS